MPELLYLPSVLYLSGVGRVRRLLLLSEVRHGLPGLRHRPSVRFVRKLPELLLHANVRRMR